MLRGNKPESEVRFELFAWGAVLVIAAVIYVAIYRVFPPFRPLILFIPGLILLGATIFQDMQPDWHAGWPSYALSILVVATGLAGLFNSLLGPALKLPWLIVAVVELGAILIVKALYDPTPR
jgi:hypothetical protein